MRYMVVIILLVSGLVVGTAEATGYSNVRPCGSYLECCGR
ncbi:MAG: hypothetical protein OJF51_001849 [Nitrospira sp.]|nr:MAG: hypothetical protein OJF51_001849 [Nitrospira sp.]